MEIPEQKKLDVLMVQLQERYNASHKMRDRSMQFVLWILGFGLGMGWFLINKATHTCLQQVMITFFLIFLTITTLWFVCAIHRGFEANRKIIIRIEKILKLHEQNSYGIDESVLPPKYSKMKRKWTGHFETLYVIVLVVFIILSILTWTNPSKLKSTGARAPLDPNQIHTQTITKE